MQDSLNDVSGGRKAVASELDALAKRGDAAEARIGATTELASSHDAELAKLARSLDGKPSENAVQASRCRGRAVVSRVLSSWGLCHPVGRVVSYVRGDQRRTSNGRMCARVYACAHAMLSLRAGHRRGADRGGRAQPQERRWPQRDARDDARIDAARHALQDVAQRRAAPHRGGRRADGCASLLVLLPERLAIGAARAACARCFSRRTFLLNVLAR